MVRVFVRFVFVVHHQNRHELRMTAKTFAWNINIYGDSNANRHDSYVRTVCVTFCVYSWIGLCRFCEVFSVLWVMCSHAGYMPMQCSCYCVTGNAYTAIIDVDVLRFLCMVTIDLAGWDNITLCHCSIFLIRLCTFCFGQRRCVGELWFVLTFWICCGCAGITCTEY